MYPYRSPVEQTKVNTVQEVNSYKGYHVRATVNNVETNFLIDTGAEVSLISADVPGLIIKESQVHPVSITHQPIVVKGETEVSLNLGSLNTTWKFLVVENMTESVLGADFIAEHHKGSWGFKIYDIAIPLIDTQQVRIVKGDNSCPVIAKCTVELPARHQLVIPMRTKDRTSRDGTFESCKTPGGVLLTKTVVQPSKDGSFLVKAVNLNFQNVTLFKNQKFGKLSDIEEVLNTAHDYQIQHDEHPVVSPIQTENIDFLHDIGIELNQSDLKRHERDVFSKNKRDLGTCKLGTKHHIHLKPDTVPVKQPLRRIPFAYQEEVKNDLKNMVKDGIIEKSVSEWASPQS